jgi:hypothetical protein
MVFELFRWWYGPGWMQAVRNIGHWTEKVEQAFSVSILLRTLFAPWRRIVSGGGRSLDAKIHDMLDNLVSRIVGFFVRLLVLIAAGFAFIIIGVLAAVMAVAWPLMPLGIVYCTVRGITG